MSIRSNTIVKSVIIFREVVSGLLDVWRAVNKNSQISMSSRCTVSQKVAGALFLHKVIFDTNNAGGHDGKSTKHLAPVGVVQGSLANAQGNQVVDEASTKDPVAASSETGKASASDSLDGCAGERILVVCNTQVVEEVEDTNTGKGLGVDVCEDGRERGSVHGAELGEDEVKLAEGVDDNEHVRDLEFFCVPEEH